MKPDRYSKTLSERAVPVSILTDTYYRTKDLPMEEKLKIREEMADNIEATYPYRKGKQPQQEECHVQD